MAVVLLIEATYRAELEVDSWLLSGSFIDDTIHSSLNVGVTTVIWGAFVTTYVVYVQ